MSKIKSILANIGVTPSKARGQNFIQSSQDASRLVQAAMITPQDSVVEIGPGLGIMTRELINTAKRIIAIEIESKFVEYLTCSILQDEDKRGNQKEEPQFICSDFREISLKELLISLDEKFKVVSNIPYVLSSEVLFWLIHNVQYIASSSLLVQREFAERIAARPSTKAYGSLSVHAQYWFEVTLGNRFSGSIFFPSASVESTQVHLIPRQTVYPVNSLELFETIIRAAFAMRRKTLVNCLVARSLFSTKSEAISVLSSLGLENNVRGENLTVLDFCKLTNIIGNSLKN